MPDTHRTETEPRTQLFDQLSHVRAGMLGVEGSGAHMRPMTHFADRDKAVLWFITSRQTDLAAEVGQGATAHYCLVGEDTGYFACLRGAIRQSDNSEMLDELWNAVAAAWFTGRDDPDLLLLEMSLRDGEVWSATDSRFQFGLEIARANLDRDAKPDIGAHTIVRF
jgi:general stress protein 26